MTIQRNLLSVIFMLIIAIALLPNQLWAGAVKIEAGKMTIYHKKNQVIFTQKVHLTRDDFELYCDRLVAYYTDKDLDRAEAFGHIRLRNGKVKGTSDNAVFNQSKGTVTLTGNAVLEQDGSHVEGDRIVHDMNSDQTVVTPAKGGRTHMTIESEGSAGNILPAENKKK